LTLSLTDKSLLLFAGKALRTEALRDGIFSVFSYLLSVLRIRSASEVIVYGFRGEARDYFFGIDPRLRFGHVGLSFDGGKTIFGFNPQRPRGLNQDEFILRIRAGESFLGSVRDDTRVFTLARTYGLRVEAVTYKMSRNEYKVAKRLLDTDVSNSPLRDKLYSFPRMDGSFDEYCYNCATYPPSIGVRTPYPSGRLKDYL
jgi:filamentous hemagglutinin